MCVCLQVCVQQKETERETAPATKGQQSFKKKEGNISAYYC